MLRWGDIRRGIKTGDTIAGFTGTGETNAGFTDGLGRGGFGHGVIVVRSGVRAAVRWWAAIGFVNWRWERFAWHRRRSNTLMWPRSAC